MHGKDNESDDSAKDESTSANKKNGRNRRNRILVTNPLAEDQPIIGQLKSPRDNTLIQVDGKELDRTSIKPIDKPEISPPISIRKEESPKAKSPREALPKISPRVSPKLSPKASPKIINITDSQPSVTSVQIISSPSKSIPTIAPRVPSPEEEIFYKTIESGNSKKPASVKHSERKPSRRHSDGGRIDSGRLSFRMPNSIKTPVQTTKFYRPEELDLDLSGLDDLSPEEEAYIRDEYNRKFDTLRRRYKNVSIPPIRDDEPVKNIVRRFLRWKKYFKQASNANNYRILLVIYFLMLEALCNKILGLKAEGFTLKSVEFLTEYDELLLELGEKEGSVNFSDWPVEVRILLLGLLHMIIFLILQYASNWIGGDIAANIMNLLIGYIKSANSFDPENPNDENGFSLENMIARIGSTFAARTDNNTATNNKTEDRATTTNYRPMHQE